MIHRDCNFVDIIRLHLALVQRVILKPLYYLEWLIFFHGLFSILIKIEWCTINYLVIATVYSLLSLIVIFNFKNVNIKSYTLECDSCYLVSLSVFYKGNLINGRSNHSSLMIVFERDCKTIMDLLFLHTWCNYVGRYPWFVSFFLL